MNSIEKELMAIRESEMESNTGRIFKKSKKNFRCLRYYYLFLKRRF